jgi:NAD(P)H dehydrogenase (quinone)
MRKETMIMTVYAVTGASGHLGRFAVKELLAHEVPASDVIALVRTRSKVAELAAHGVQVREADYSRPETLEPALAGVDRLLLVSGSLAGQRVAHYSNVIAAAQACGVSRIAYTGMLNNDDTTNPLAGEHQDTEQVLCEAGVPFTSLRNGWYIENYTHQLAQYLATGEILGAAGGGEISAASRQDYAVAAVTALVGDEGGDRIYELGGPAFNLTQFAETITEMTGTPVIYRDLSVGEFAAGCSASASTRSPPGCDSRLDWTIVRAYGLFELPETTNYSAGEVDPISAFTARIDLADCLVRVVTDTTTIGSTLSLDPRID